jgi:uroporphyrinogen decarboxylase
MEMNPRERIRAALNHEEPDRVPIDLSSVGPTGIHRRAYQRLLDVLGMQEAIQLRDVSSQLAQPSERVLELIGADVRGIRVGGAAYNPAITSETEITDQWGAVWRRTADGLCYSLAHFPLQNADLSDLATYPWPDGKDPELFAGLAERARYLHEETPYAVLGEFAGHIFERAQMVRGFDTFLEDLLINRGFAEELMDRILAIEIDIVSGFLNAVGSHIDIIAFKDDLAMQSGPIVSPTLFREAVKPRMRKLIEAIRSKTRAKLWFHSCGSVYFAIPDLIELGIDILNPVQVRAADMDTARLKREFGQHLAFWGGIDTQHVLPFGTPEDVRREVRQRIQDLAPGGGYVLASVHNIEADVPGENIWAMAQAVHEYGRYPIHKSIW